MSVEFPAEYFDVRFSVPDCEVAPAWPAEFAILTAYATTGQTWSTERNVGADRELAAWCDASGLPRQRITGYSPITGHAEPGWAISLDFSVACRLGVRFRQHACFFVQADELWVVACSAPAQRTRIGSFRDRLRQR